MNETAPRLVFEPTSKLARAAAAAAGATCRALLAVEYAKARAVGTENTWVALVEKICKNVSVDSDSNLIVSH